MNHERRMSTPLTLSVSNSKRVPVCRSFNLYLRLGVYRLEARTGKWRHDIINYNGKLDGGRGTVGYTLYYYFSDSSKIPGRIHIINIGTEIQIRPVMDSCPSYNPTSSHTFLFLLILSNSLDEKKSTVRSVKCMWVVVEVRSVGQNVLSTK